MISEDYTGELVQDVESGKVVIPFVNGKKHGLSKFICSEGIVLAEIPYVDDDIHGEMKQYYANGSILSIMEYVRGVLCGRFISFFENGMKRLETSYKDGEFDGKFAAFDEFGDKVSEVSYQRGKKVGNSVLFYPKSLGGGEFELSNYNDNGLLNGNVVTLYQSGKIMSVTPYINGRAQEYTKTYSENGAEIKT
ncbi:hypothetical protein FACS1894113_5050 [Alphaproteobacteria bacterium]|nr:hypothetical protein FACS1894113_5050 [Alphaproteobacteria bacterium]